MRQFSRLLLRVVDVINGPYRGHTARIDLDAAFVWYRPPDVSSPRERYAVVDIGFGVRELHHAPPAPADAERLAGA